MADGRQKCSACSLVKPKAEFSLSNRQCNSCRKNKHDAKANSSLKGFLTMRLTALKQRHRSKGYTEDVIDLAHLMDLYEEQRGICALTGIPMHITTSESDMSVSPDRIDSDLGYSEGNVRLVCVRANLMMNNLDDAHFKWWCRAVIYNDGK